MSNSVITTNGVMVVTQVYPQQIVPSVPAPCTVPRVSSVLGKFLKVQPKALGTVQIMIGFIIILFGIVMTTYADTIAVFSGIVYWGSLIYISSGALTVAADKLKKCLVKGALVLNIFSTITAGFAIILHSFDFVINMKHCHYYSDCGSSNYYECILLKNMYKARSYGITGVLLVFSILEFIISICVSGFACKAVCHRTSEQTVFVQSPTAQVVPTSSGYLPIPALNTSEAIFSIAVPQSIADAIKTDNQTDRPPAYNAIHM